MQCNKLLTKKLVSLKGIIIEKWWWKCEKQWKKVIISSYMLQKIEKNHMILQFFYLPLSYFLSPMEEKSILLQRFYRNISISNFSSQVGMWGLHQNEEYLCDVMLQIKKKLVATEDVDGEKLQKSVKKYEKISCIF